MEITVALSFWQRLTGLAGRRTLAGGRGLLLARTRSVHTCGMRFALDLVWIDGSGRVVRIDRCVRPWRVRTCLRARGGVLELAADEASRAGVTLGTRVIGENQV